MNREEIINSPSTLAIYSMFDKPLPGDEILRVAEALGELKAGIDTLRAELREWGEELRLREAARQGAVITRDDDNDAPAADEAPIQRRPATVR
jgi:hypothetical protein